MTVVHEPKGRGLEVHDFLSAALFFAFALFSLLWPETGRISLAGRSIPRGFLAAPALLLLGLAFLSLGRFSMERAPGIVRFLRMFYPQAYFAFMFLESILLSAPVGMGASHDALFARLDLAIFGFQPSREFSAALGSIPAVNELMFGAYFSFFLVLTLTPWLAWFKGDKEECRKQMAVFSAYMCIVFVFYVFFRVMGPKYYFADLKVQRYGQFAGGFFTNLLKGIFDGMTLSGSAFPSSHVAVSLLMTLFAWRSYKFLLPFYIVLDLLIAASTVYLYAHWAADVTGAVFTAIILLPLLFKAHAPAAGFVARLNMAASGSGAA